MTVASFAIAVRLVGATVLATAAICEALTPAIQATTEAMRRFADAWERSRASS